MVRTDVSSCVLSILAAFSSAIDVVKGIEQTRRKSRKSKTRTAGEADDEETKLVASLTHGSTSIVQEYQRSLEAAGEGFVVGDAIAHTALAEVLFRLNASLVTIINQFLRRGEVWVDYGSLIDTSECARKDTCDALRQLSRRLVLLASPKELYSGGLHAETKAPDGRKKKTHISTNDKHSKIRRPTLAQVVIADSSKAGRIAMVRPGGRAKQTKQSKSRVKTSSLVRHTPQQNTTQPVCYPLPISSDPSVSRRKSSAVELRQPRLAPVPDVLRETASVTDLGAGPCRSSRRVPSTPLLNNRSRRPTPTYYSIESDSTKLGEIPMHKWHKPYDFEAMSMLNKEAIENGWPLDNGQIDQQKKNRRFGFFRLFGSKKPS